MDGGLLYPANTFVGSKSRKLIEFVGTKALKIPDHQRDYSWENDEIEQFLKDLDTLHSKDFLLPHTLPHFFGSIVLIEDQNQQTYEVIDGQQRLTTTMLFHAILYAVALEKLKNTQQISIVMQRIHSYLYLSQAGQTNKLRLSLNRANSYFNNILDYIYNYKPNTKFLKGLALIPRSLDVEDRIYDSCEIIYKHLNSAINNGHSIYDSLMQYIEAVQNMMVVIELIVYQPGVAYTIFETLNARGKGLSAADLIKNSLFSFAQQQGTLINHTSCQSKCVMENWVDTVDLLTQYDKVDFTDFLEHSYISRRGVYGANNLFDAIQTILENQQVTALDYSKEIVEDSYVYLKILSIDKNTDQYFTQNVIDLLDELNNFIRVRRIYPLLLSGRQNLNIADFECLVKVSVNFAYRFIVVEKNAADTLYKLVEKWSKGLYSKNITLNDIVDNMKKQSRDGSFKNAFEIFSPKTNKLSFYTINKIEHYIASGQGGLIPFDQSPTQHLEHIMPKTPTPNYWPNLFVRDQNGNFILLDEFHIYINRIGNHTILERDINIHIKNKDFKYKNTNQHNLDFQHSKLNLPVSIQKYLDASKHEWTFQSIDTRGKDFANYAINIWNFTC